MYIKANILIDQDCRPRLADFGLLTIVSDAAISTSGSCVEDWAPRWMSPELLNPDMFGFKESRPTKESDCYALGMVVLEVLSGRPPLASDKVFIVMRKIMDGKRPGRPEGPEGEWFTDDLWRMLELCWAARPESRPSIEAVLECLEQVSRAREPSSQEVDGDVGADGGDLNPSPTPHARSKLLTEGGYHGTGCGGEAIYRSVNSTGSQLLPLTVDVAVDDNTSVRTEGNSGHPAGSTNQSDNVSVTAGLGVLPPPNDTTIRDLQPSIVHPTSGSSTLVDLEESACRRLISHSFSPHELPSLIWEIFTETRVR